ncbi:putative type IX secretion system sortase PorU2 [Niabella aquatica]
MKKLLFILSFFYWLAAGAQQFNNEWIDHSKTYYKFKVGTTGLYRIPQSLLAMANLANTDVSQFQLWRNGEEVPVYTSSQAGILAAGGYIEFWGEANDGRPDRALYRNISDQINNSKSLFTDSAAYFLTVNPAGNNKRLVPTPNNIPAGATAEPYFIYTHGIYPNETIHLGPYAGEVSSASYSASFEGGEGWTSNEITENQTKNLPQTGLYPFTGSGAPAMQVNMNVVGNSPNSRAVQMLLNNTQVFNASLTGFSYAKLSATLPVSVLTGATENISVSNNTTGPNNRIKIGFIEISYPRAFNFGGAANFRFKVAGNSTGKYLEITGFNYSGVPVLYDLANGRRYEGNVTNPSLVKVYVQAATTAPDLVLVNQAASNIKTVSNLEVRNFTNYLVPANQGNYLIITHKVILNGANGTQPVEEYRAYRSSAAGGGYNAKIYMIDELADQFAYGIKGSPLSVRNFLRFARSRFSAPLQSAFIMGRGVKYTSARYNESDPVTDRLNLIPTFGEPASDILLAAEGASSIPLTPIGRVSVTNGNELAVYLEKIKQYEAHLSPDPAVEASTWKKNIIHMVGSSEQALIDQLYSYLNVEKKVIQDTLYGATVYDFVKSAIPGSEQTAAQRLRALINEGVSLLTYFGHSAATTLVFNIENPEEYSNQGKYPVFHMMGCNVGDIFIWDKTRLTNITTISEKYLFAKERGSIGMMAGTSLGRVGSLQLYNRELYKLLSGKGYGLTLGELMQKTATNAFAVSGGESDPYNRAQNEEYTLNGDPAIRLYQFAKPDYAIEDAMVTVTPAIVSVTEPNFTIKARIANLGKAVDNKLIVELKRTFPDLSVKVIKRDTIAGVRYMDSLNYQINIDPMIDKGASKFTITLDPENAVDELFETNNTITKEVFIYEDDIKPVFPYNYSIINRQDIVLAASTGNPFAGSRSYIMEMDTTKLFNSSLKISQTKVSSGGVIEFTPGTTFKDSTVYYWRVSAVPASPSDQQVWNSASFTYIAGDIAGFSQSHYQQFDAGLFENISMTAPGRLSFDSLRSEIIIRNVVVTPGSSVPLVDVSLQIDGIIVQQGTIADPAPGKNPHENSLRFYLIDNRNLKAVNNRDLGTSGLYGSYRPIARSQGSIPYFFQFDISSVESRKTVMAFLDSIPDGFFVGITSNLRGPTILPSVWESDTAVLGSGVSLYHRFKEIGLTAIDEVKSFVPYIFIYQKGKPMPLAQEVGNTGVLEVRTIVPVSGTTGTVKSPVFTRSASWKKIVWNGYSLESPATDTAFVSIIGIDKNGQEAELMKDLPVSQKEADLSGINAAIYPGLRIVMRSTDAENRSPYQLKYWSLYGTSVPEGAIAPNLYYSARDTVEAGEPLNMGVAFKNVSPHNFDSLSVKLSIRDQNNVERIIPVPKVKPLTTGDTTKVNVSLDTRSFTGNNLVFLEFNPDGGYHQPEQHQFNNFISKNFYVRGDSTSPYLDVTFDGVHILNRDIISGKPQILMKLTDDAKYLLLNNTDLVKVQLKHPDGITRDYRFNSDTLILTPPAPNDESNTATISFKPHLSEDGEYELIVSAKDQSGNKTGLADYRIAFQVINKPMISNLLNYPNPFTTSTAFVFTLTGSEIPQNIRIQILTVTGKIVREITKAELGPLRIGRNITEFKWDGTDQYGQKLANGVYLYRVLTNLNGKALDKYKAAGDNTDRYFNKGYGKMVLIR